MHYEIVETRILDTFKSLFKKTLLYESILIKEGHQSYPGAVAHINVVNSVVNYLIRFKNIDGFYTRNIENLWSSLKYKIKKRKGVIKSSIPFFLLEFQFRYSNLRGKKKSEVINVFDKILFK
jgi:hypothetical protein